jgi:hypothetical protein
MQIWSETPGVIVAYRGFVQDHGWLGEVSDGQAAGTVGKNLRMEAIQIRLAARGPFSHVQYRVQPRGLAFQQYITDGMPCSSNSQCPTNLCAFGTCAAGTNGQSRAIEQIQINVF